MTSWKDDLMLMFGGSQVSVLGMNRDSEYWHTTVSDCWFEIGGRLLVAVHQPGESLIFDEWPATTIPLATVVDRLIRADGTLPFGQFDGFYLSKKDPGGHAARWDLTLFAKGHRPVAASLTLLADIAQGFLQGLEIGYREDHLHEDNDEVEAGLAVCLSRAGAVVAGLSAADLVLLENEEIDLTDHLL